MILLVPLLAIHTAHTSFYPMLLIKLAVGIASTRISMHAFKNKCKIVTFLSVITESQNYRIAELGKDLMRSSSPNPC